MDAATPAPWDSFFDRPFDRSGTGSSKWLSAGADPDPGRIPLGLADMDLPGPPAVAEALAARVAHPALGYTVCDPGGRELVAAWYRTRHGAAVDPEWVLLLPFGPRTAIRLLLEALRAGRTGPPGPVLLPTPEYGGFAPTCRAAGLPYREVPLALEEDGYRLPVAEFARYGGRPLTAVLLSSPHNPTARVWERSAIRALAEVAAESGGVLISDEVHADLVHPGHRHPVAVEAAGDLAPATVTLHSVGKTFNTTGLPSAFALVPDPVLRARLREVMAGYGLWEGGLLTQVAQRAALEHGGAWLDGLLAYLAGNRDLAVDALRRLAPRAVPSPPQASYLLWLDATALGLPVDRARALLLDRCGLGLQDGAGFGSAGRGFLRLNYALPRRRLAEALDRLARSADPEGGRPVPPDLR
ncbi:MalY/PatB family protein [Peterkaempfera bronchialis]|uniref:cysteine-S-conjugate beta-lyase n=1 Tax=Peterkaempfera bronchialis TaxID=2126346 RepID=A0A345SSM6_9ACTN|nr:aminotransferase class I/II-fold pyridoxal phosphate-dependent enzyme [Peterkaempfera bronchialis]AXI76731.1 aminotransferase class I/II-fold pyridoxal phosphate-dependent enzyme [Peterkaempfera bronchialis]